MNANVQMRSPNLLKPVNGSDDVLQCLVGDYWVGLHNADWSDSVGTAVGMKSRSKVSDKPVFHVIEHWLTPGR